MERRPHSYFQDKAVFIPISSPVANWEPSIRQKNLVGWCLSQHFLHVSPRQILFIPISPPTCKGGAFNWPKMWLGGVSFNIFCVYLQERRLLPHFLLLLQTGSHSSIEISVGNRLSQHLLPITPRKCRVNPNFPSHLQTVSQNLDDGRCLLQHFPLPPPFPEAHRGFLSFSLRWTPSSTASQSS